MAEKTPNLNLSLPSQSDPANVEVLNENFRKLDEHAMVHPDMAVNDPNDLRYIENRLAYKEEGTIVFFPTMTVSNVGLAEEWVYVAQYLRYPLVAGNTYTVTVNGESRDIVAQAVGNAVVLDGPGYYAFFSEGDDTRVRLRANTSATYGIVGEGEVVNPMGSEYLTFSGRPKIEEMTDGDMVPVAREDGSVALIPRNKIGGGGMPEGTAPNQMMVTDGGGVAKWEERTHYPYHTRVLILPELDYSTLDYVENSLSQDITPYMQGEIVVGETYYLTYGDEVLECRAYADGLDDVIIAENNDFLSSRVGIIYRDGQYLFSVNDGANPKTTIKIEGPGIAYKRLEPEKYLPEGYPYVERKNVTICEVSATQEEAEAGGELGILSPLGATVEVGGQYHVTFAGVLYECVAKAFDPGIGAVLPILGDLGAMTGEEADATGEPFVIAFVPPGMEATLGGVYGIVQLLLPENAEVSFPLTIKVDGEGKIIHTMDENLLPKMSGGGSGTKIDITVDADGNCTTDARFGDAYNLTAAELQASITIHTETEEWGVFGLAKKPYGAGNAITFYVLPFNDGTLIGLQRFTWMGTKDGTMSMVYKEAYRWEIAAE